MQAVAARRRAMMSQGRQAQRRGVACSPGQISIIVLPHNHGVWFHKRTALRPAKLLMARPTEPCGEQLSLGVPCATEPNTVILNRLKGLARPGPQSPNKSLVLLSLIAVATLISRPQTPP